MRGIRSSVISILVVGLVAGSTVGVVAQDDESTNRMPPTEFSTFVDCLWVPFRDGEVTNTVVGTVEDGNLVLRESRGFVWRSPEFEASDPRLSGTFFAFVETDEYVTPHVAIEDAPRLQTIVQRIENEDGAWQGSAAIGGWRDYPEDISWSPSVLLGEGAYEGLSALWVDRWSEEPCGWEVKGVVFDGVLPPDPEPPAE